MNQALQEEFRAKTISAQQAAALVKSGQQVYLGCCTSYARAIADALAARSEELEDVTIGCSYIIPPMTVLDCAHPQAFRISTYFMCMRSGGPGKRGGRTSPRSIWARWTSGAGRPSIRTWPFLMSPSPTRRAT